MSLEEKILNLYKKEYQTVKQQRIVDILKVVLVDKETNINKIVELTSTTAITIEKYAYDKNLITQFITEEEYEIFKQHVDNILNLKSKIKNINDPENEKKELTILKNVVDDILHTRYKLEEICRKNYINKVRVENIFYRTDYLNITFGLGMKEKIKNKIAENGLIRSKKPRNSILIEDRWDIFVANSEIYYLNELDYRKLKFAGSYLCSGADMEYVIKKHETDFASVIALLSDLKLKSILKPEYYENLKRYINIEKVLANSELSAKKTLLFNIVHVLNECNYDKQLTLNYFNLPVCLFNKLLKEITIFTFFDENIRSNVRLLLDEEITKKVK